MLREVQDHVCRSVEEVDGGAKFRRDSWSREDGGGGVSAVLANGKVSTAIQFHSSCLSTSHHLCRCRYGRRPAATLPSSTAPCRWRLFTRPTIASRRTAAPQRKSTSSQVTVRLPRERREASAERARCVPSAHTAPPRTRAPRRDARPPHSGRRDGALLCLRPELRDAPPQPALPHHALQLPLLRDRGEPFPPPPPPLAPSLVLRRRALLSPPPPPSPPTSMTDWVSRRAGRPVVVRRRHRHHPHLRRQGDPLRLLFFDNSCPGRRRRRRR